MRKYKGKNGTVEAVEVDEDLYGQIVSFHRADDGVYLNEHIAEATILLNGRPVVLVELDGEENTLIQVGDWLIYDPTEDGILVADANLFLKNFCLVKESSSEEVIFHNDPEREATPMPFKQFQGRLDRGKKD